MPLDGVVPIAWRDAVIERDPQGRTRINRITYEICALQALREQLRCKEIWVEGADRYRNPDEDLPVDFEDRRDEHYAALGLPRDADAFIARVQAEMTEALTAFDSGLAANPLCCANIAAPAASQLVEPSTDPDGGWHTKACHPVQRVASNLCFDTLTGQNPSV